MESAILIPLAPFFMVVAIVGVVQSGRTIRHYLDWRLRMAERQGGAADSSVLQALQALREEIAALKRHESDAVLSFDSTLQRLEARLSHLERRSLGALEGERRPLAAGAQREGEPVG